MTDDERARVEAMKNTLAAWSPRFPGGALEAVAWLLDLVERQEARIAYLDELAHKYIGMETIYD